MKAAFYTLGCKVNQYETQIMEQKLSEAGYEIVSPDEPADVYIVNSCTVTGESDRKTRQILRRLRRLNPAALTVLSGCFPQSFPEKAEAIREADVVTGTRERGNIARIISQALETGRRVELVSDFEKDEPFEAMQARGLIGRTRAFVKIEDGCSRYCSYCIIPYSRGPVRSKPLPALGREISSLAARGYKEMVLVGINLSSYGKDCGLTLADALETIERVPGDFRVRLGSLDPELIDADFLARARTLKKLCPHFHLSLQSGCAATLKRMNRPYSPAEYARSVALLREAFPGCGVTTDVIVGFPGETPEEFGESLAFVERIGFSQMHVFMYSRREGTRAARMPGQIEKNEKERRSRRMIEAGLRSRREFLERQAGETLPVLFEAASVPGEYEGFAPNYAPVRLRSQQDLHGRLLTVRVTGVDPADGEACRGEPCGAG